MAGGMRGVDVERVEALAVSEDKQDIEDAAVQASVEDVVDASCKKLVELQISKHQKQQAPENDENEPKTVPNCIFSIIYKSSIWYLFDIHFSFAHFIC